MLKCSQARTFEMPRQRQPLAPYTQVYTHQTSTDGCTVTDRPTSEDHGDVPQVADFKLPALKGPSGSTVPSLRLTEHGKLAGNCAPSRGVVLVDTFKTTQ
jgi:hypothetical protein